MLLDEMGERVRSHDLANIARPQQPVGGLFSALRSSPVPQCMLAALYMSMHIHMCRFTLDVMAICRVSRTFSGIMLATRFPGVTAFRTCMARITNASCLFLGSLHHAIRGVTERGMSEISAELQENSGKPTKTDTQVIIYTSIRSAH